MKRSISRDPKSKGALVPTSCHSEPGRMPFPYSPESGPALSQSGGSGQRSQRLRSTMKERSGSYAEEESFRTGPCPCHGDVPGRLRRPPVQCDLGTITYSYVDAASAGTCRAGVTYTVGA